MLMAVNSLLRLIPLSCPNPSSSSSIIFHVPFRCCSYPLPSSPSHPFPLSFVCLFLRSSPILSPFFCFSLQSLTHSCFLHRLESPYPFLYRSPLSPPLSSLHLFLLCLPLISSSATYSTLSSSLPLLSYSTLPSLPFPIFHPLLPYPPFNISLIPASFTLLLCSFLYLHPPPPFLHLPPLSPPLSSLHLFLHGLPLISSAISSTLTSSSLSSILTPLPLLFSPCPPPQYIPSSTSLLVISYTLSPPPCRLFLFIHPLPSSSLATLLLLSSMLHFDNEDIVEETVEHPYSQIL